MKKKFLLFIFVFLIFMFTGCGQETAELAQYLPDPQEATHVVRDLTDLTEEVDGLTLKWVPDSLRTENEIVVSYEFKRNNEDSYTYIAMEFAKVEGEWKVSAIGYEK